MYNVDALISGKSYVKAIHVKGYGAPIFNINSSAICDFPQERYHIAVYSRAQCLGQRIIMHVPNRCCVVATRAAIAFYPARRGADDAQGRYQAERQ